MTPMQRKLKIKIQELNVIIDSPKSLFVTSDHVDNLHTLG